MLFKIILYILEKILNFREILEQVLKILDKLGKY